MAFFSSLGGIIKGIGNALTGTVSVVGGIWADVFGRIIGGFGFIFDIIGLRLTKKLRMRFIILSNGAAPVIPEANVLETFKLTKRVFMEQAKIELIKSETLTVFNSPEGALNISSPVEGFLEQWTTAGNYLNGLAGFGFFTRRLSVIVVDTIEGGHDGRSYGPGTNFVVIEKSRFSDPKKTTLLVGHEMGHACGLFIHRDQKVNIMHEDGDRGEKMTWWQSNVVRNSKFVWYL